MVPRLLLFHLYMLYVVCCMVHDAVPRLLRSSVRICCAPPRQGGYFEFHYTAPEKETVKKATDARVTVTISMTDA